MSEVYYYVDQYGDGFAVYRKQVYDSGQWRIDREFVENFHDYDKAVKRAEKLNKEEG